VTARVYDERTCVMPLGSTQMNLVLSRILRRDEAFAGLTLRSRTMAVLLFTLPNILSPSYSAGA